MRPCGLLLIAGLAAGCSADPSLDLAVHHPAGYGVIQTVVTVYAGDIQCNEIEYGDHTDAELAALTADEVDVTGGGKIDVSRLGGKSLVARGFDAQHRFVTAGCKDVGEITSGTKVSITTQPTAVVAIDPGQPDRPFSERTILVTISDINGAALDGTVSWQLTGPAGAADQPPSDGLPTASGQAKIHVNDLGTPGPEGLRIRAPWATSPLPLVTAFDLSHATTIALDGSISSGLHPSCDVRGHAGKPPSLVCLTQATNVQGHRDAVEIAWQTDHYASTPLALPASVNSQFAVFVDHDGSADEPVYIVSDNAPAMGNWYKLGASGNGTSVTFDNALQNVVYVAACQAGSPAAVGVTTGPLTGVGAALLQKEAFFTVAGVQSRATMDGEAFSGGCVIDVDNQAHQGVVVTNPLTGDPALFLVGTTDPISTSKLAGSGFVAISSGGATERRFTGTRLQASGTVVYEAVLAREASSYRLVERTEVDAAAPPIKIVGGKLDHDGDTDLMWDMSAGNHRRIFQVSLARQVNGEPLTAMTSGPAGVSATTTVDFVTGDLDGNGVDEIILFTPTAVTIYAP